MAEDRVLILAEPGPDADLIGPVLRRLGLRSAACRTIGELCAALDDGAAAVVLGEEALVGEDGEALIEWVSRQPAWSDLPVIVLAGAVGPASNRREHLLEALGNVLLLQRPLDADGLFGALRLAARARRRQYQARGLFEERQRAAAALGASEERLRLAVEATAIGIWDVNVATGERRWSPEFCAILGLPPDASPDPDLFSSLIHPDDRAWVEERYARAYRPGSDGSYKAEFRIRRARDGVERWVLTIGRISFDGNGRPLRGVGTLLDVTEAHHADEAVRRSEELFRNLADSLPHLIWVMRPDGFATYFNRRFKEYHGYTVTGDLADRASTIHPDDKEAAWRIREPAIAAGLPFETVVRTRRHDGVYRWFRMTATPLKRDGEVAAYVGIAIDIDDMRRAEQELQHLVRHQQLLINELNHRVKNTLATVQSIAMQTFRGGDNGDDTARQTFEARLLALAKAHDVLTRENWEGADLEELVLEAISPIAGMGRVAVGGPAVRLRPAMALPIAMAMYELATNAAKFGALANDSGRISIAWDVRGETGEGALHVRWAESGGPPVEPPRRRGFGSRLIERALAAELNGETRIDFRPSGVVCLMQAPLQR